MRMLAPRLAPRLDRELAGLAQALPFDDRMELMGALDHIARELRDDPKPMARWSHPRIPQKARRAVCAITRFGFVGSWLSAHQRPWEETDKYEAVVKAATATAIYAKTSPALDDVPRYRVELLDNVLWLMTCAPSGKYATRYRTKAAVDDPYATPATLRHEHVYTRQRLIHDLLAAEESHVEAILRDCAIGCVVTKEEEEHNRLTQFDKTHEGWGRYREAGIVVLDMLTGHPADLGRSTD